MSQLGEFIQAQLAAAVPNTTNNGNKANQATDGNTPATSGSDHDFVPPVDVFDTETSYVVHVSLAGAKKEDLSVNWDVEKSELVVAGVVYRPGDEALLKTLALDERKVGAFQRKVALGGAKEKKVEVEVEGIAAKMVDGVLVVTLPKKDAEEFEQVFHVDVD
jgi:HSP20 family protein